MFYDRSKPPSLPSNYPPKLNPVNMAQPHSMLPQPAVIETRPARMPLHKPEPKVYRLGWDLGKTTIQSNPHAVSTVSPQNWIQTLRIISYDRSISFHLLQPLYGYEACFSAIVEINLLNDVEGCWGMLNLWGVRWSIPRPAKVWPDAQSIYVYICMCIMCLRNVYDPNSFITKSAFFVKVILLPNFRELWGFRSRDTLTNFLVLGKYETG